MSPWHRFITVDDRNQVAYAYVTDFMMAEGLDETKRSNPITLSDGDIIRHQARHLVKYNNQLNDVETFDAATRKRIQRQYRAIIEEFGGVPYSMAAAKPERKFSQLARKKKSNPGRKPSKAVTDRAKLVKQAFALREETGSRIQPKTIIKDPAACIRRMKRKK
tara:strand:- start:247 stop:735 length:489 start_codon:yes stop_codon:yes gene_type:complete